MKGGEGKFMEGWIFSIGGVFKISRESDFSIVAEPSNLQTPSLNTARSHDSETLSTNIRLVFAEKQGNHFQQAQFSGMASSCRRCG